MEGLTTAKGSSADRRNAEDEARIDDFETRILENAIIHSRRLLSNETIIKFRDELHEAVEFARRAHEGQFRKNGDPYIYHPLSIALDISSSHMADPTTIYACLFHDILEDTDVDPAVIAERFGQPVLRVVEGLTKIKNQKIESFDKFFQLSLRYPRILFIKIFDRFHNMRTIHHLPVEKQKRIARETLDIYHKICDRLALTDIADQLELLCCQVLFPEQVENYSQRVKSLTRRHRQDLDEVERKIRTATAEHGIRLVSTNEYWRPFLRKDRYDDVTLSEVFRLNLLTEDREDIYRLLGRINELFIHVRGSIHDFVSSPKYNNYRSLDVDVVHKGVKVPIGITTVDFNTFNRKGILTYGFSDDRAMNLEYMRHLESYLKSETHFRDLEKVFAHHNPEEITVISKDGQPFDMERSSTALDFAFKIHSEVGQRASYAVIDGRKVPLDTRLDDGDMIRIVTSETHVLTPDHLNWCSNLKTKRAIASFLNRRNRDRAEAMGLRFLEKKLFAYHIDTRRFWGVFDAAQGRDRRQDTVLGLFNDREGVEALLVDLGLIDEKKINEIRALEENFLRRMGLRLIGKSRSAVTLEAEYRDDLLLLCPHCVPTLKDNPIAVFAGDRLHVHRSNCSTLKDVPRRKHFPLRWLDSGEKRGGTVEIRTKDVYGVFNTISSAFRQAKINIAEHTGKRSVDGAVFRIRIDETDADRLSKLLEILRGTSEVNEIELRH